MNLTDGLIEHLQDVPAPPANLDLVVERGQRIRARRQVTGMAIAAAAVLAGITLFQPGGAGHDVTSDPPIAAQPMDLSNGLRAYADPGRELRMGGRSFSAKDLAYLDTDAATTPHGLVFFRGGRPFLLDEDGTSRALWQDPVDDPKGWHPTAKVDRRGHDLVFAVSQDDRVQLVVFDLARSDAISVELDCGAEPGCDGVVVDGVDSGAAFVRTSHGTWLWEYADHAEDGLQPFAGTATRVADVRNKTLLYDGPRPTVTLEGWTYVAGAVDSQLTFDGRNVLAWSPVLKSVGNGEAISLRLPQPATFFTIDTDGSVLAATVGDPAVFFDCELPSGRCEQIGRMRMTGGDPMFIGNDM